MSKNKIIIIIVIIVLIFAAVLLVQRNKFCCELVGGHYELRKKIIECSVGQLCDPQYKMYYRCNYQSPETIQTRLNAIGVDKEQLNKAREHCHLQAYETEVGLDAERSEEEVRRDIYNDCLSGQITKLKNQQK